MGKTSTTASVGSILASRGYKVLVIDLDAQANLTVSLLKEEQEESIYYALTGKEESLPIVPVTPIPIHRTVLLTACHGGDGTDGSHLP